MASITYWHRLEPRPRARDLNDTLAARLRDPLWLLSRQWQFGEFRGEDAGSPAFVSLRAEEDPVAAWRGLDAQWRPWTDDRPLESALLAESFDPADLSLQVELALAFERELRAQAGLSGSGADALLDQLRQALPLGGAQPADPADADAARLRLVCAPRSFDGVALAIVSSSEPPQTPAGVNVSAADAAAFVAAQRGFARTVVATYGGFGATTPPAWRPERLEFEGALATSAAARVDYRITPEVDASLDWFALDQIKAAGEVPKRKTSAIERSVVPVHVGFRGMPNARWWDFESGETDYGDLHVDRQDIAKLVVMDFMLIHGNDWFIVPIEQHVGSRLRVWRVVVTDVFGDRVLVPAANADRPWTLFACSVDGAADAAPDLLLPPSAGSAIQFGDALEDVRFLRDEGANLVWAVERIVASRSGDPAPANERPGAPPMPPPAQPPTGLRYLIQTDVPRNWIPFVPVSLDPVRGDIALERAAMLDATVHPPQPIPPAGRILRPNVDPYQVREEEISRAGVRVVRVACRSRWVDGSTHLWMMRMRKAGGGEGSSGLLFDLAKDV